MTNALAFLSATRPPKTIPGKEYGVHAGLGPEGELVYIGMGDITMYRHVLDEQNRRWDKVFGYHVPISGFGVKIP